MVVGPVVGEVLGAVVGADEGPVVDELDGAVVGDVVGPVVGCVAKKKEKPQTLVRAVHRKKCSSQAISLCFVFINFTF